MARNDRAEPGPELRRRFSSTYCQAVGLVCVALAMFTLFLRPESTYFVYGVAISIPAMVLATYLLTGFKDLFAGKTVSSIGFGLLSAAILYLVFYAGNSLVRSYGFLVGIKSASEVSIYSTIGSHTLLLQIIILILDAIGFESYFRGNLQNFFASRIGGRFKLCAPFLAAFLDAAIHVISLNPLWMITTFIADSIWGLTYYYTGNLSSSMTSHFVWDLLIFVIAPIG